MAKWRLFIPLAFLFGFSLWSALRGLETIRTQRYDFTYSVGPRGRTDFSRSIHFEGAEAIRVGCAMSAFGVCGLVWLVALGWPSPPGTLRVHHGLARVAAALYIFSVFALLPPWRLTSPPLAVFYSVHGVLYGLWIIFRNIKNPDRQKQFIALAILAWMLGIPFLTTLAIHRGGKETGHDIGFAACAALVSAVFGAAQRALLNQKGTWGI